MPSKKSWRKEVSHKQFNSRDYFIPPYSSKNASASDYWRMLLRLTPLSPPKISNLIYHWWVKKCHQIGFVELLFVWKNMEISFNKQVALPSLHSCPRYSLQNEEYCCNNLLPQLLATQVLTQPSRQMAALDLKVHCWYSAEWLTGGQCFNSQTCFLGSEPRKA